MANSCTKEEIFNKICEILENEFEIDKSLLKEDADIFEDLDLDSIDAVDLAARIQQYSQKRFSPEEFKQIRTLGDVVEVLYKHISE